MSDVVPKIPPATLPHPHTMKLGDFLQHTSLYRKLSLKKFLKTAFSRVGDKSIKLLKEKGLSSSLLKKTIHSIGEKDYKNIFSLLHDIDLPKPSSQSVLVVGEKALAESVHRLGNIDFFSVITRKPKYVIINQLWWKLL